MTITEPAADSGTALSQGQGRMLAYLGALAFMTATAVPMGFFYFVVPAMLREVGHSPEIVGAFSVVYLPYVLRGLWAFAIERVMQGWARRYRLGTLGFALSSAAALLALIPLDPAQNVGPIVAVALLVFVLLASGMTTLDGYLLATLSPDDRARSSAWSAAGGALGGVLVGIMAWFDVFSSSWTSAIVILALATLVPSLLVLLLPRVPQAQVQKRHEEGASKGALRGIFLQPNLRALAFLALSVHLVLGLLSGYMPVLQIDAGLNVSEIGLFSAVASNIIGLLGALLGGLIVNRIGGWRGMVFLALAMALCLAAAGGVYEMFWGKGFALVYTALTMLAAYVYFVPFRALVLKACDGTHGVSQVALLSSFDMTVGVFAMMFAGVVVVQMGLGLFFFAMALVSLWAAYFAFTKSR